MAAFSGLSIKFQSWFIDKMGGGSRTASGVGPSCVADTP